MAKSDYYPVKLGDQRLWLVNYRNMIPTHGLTLGMTLPEVDDNVNAADQQIVVIDAAITAENTYKGAIDTRDDAAKINVTLIRKTTKRNKTSPAYTTTIGDFLGVEGAETEFNAATYKPEGSATAVLNVVTVKFVKDGADGEAIYCRIITGAAATKPAASGPSPTPEPPNAAEIKQFKKIGVDYHSPYIDNRPLQVAGQPELREYYLRGVVEDVEIGVPSDVFREVVGE